MEIDRSALADRSLNTSPDGASVAADDVLYWLDRLVDVRIDEFEGDDLVDLMAKFDEAEAKLAAAKAAHLASYDKRRLFRPRCRSGATDRASLRRMNGRHTGAELNVATALAKLPLVWQALAAGSITIEHAKLLVRLFRRPHLRDAVIDDQAWHVNNAETLGWAAFEQRTDNWAELVDPRDPADIEPGFDKRSLTWARGVGGTSLLHLDTTDVMLDQLLAAIQPIFDQLLDQEWADARATAVDQGDDPDAVTSAHLARTDTMRRHDALMILIRKGGANTCGDPGVTPTVAVTVDLATLLWAAQAANRSGYLQFSRSEADRTEAEQPDTDSLPVRHRKREAEAYRCETTSGARLAPALALWCSLAGHIHRVTLNQPDRTTSVSTKARFFNESQNLGMLVRDRHCRGPGCGRQPDHGRNKLDADHIDPAGGGGPTHTANGQMLCKPCHRHKTWLQATGFWAAAEPLWNPNHPAHANQPDQQG